MECPFRRFIISQYFSGYTRHTAANTCLVFGYHASEKDVGDIYSELINILPQSIKDVINSGGFLDSQNGTHEEWLKHFGVFELYDFMSRRKKQLTDRPEYFKWMEDIIWINKLPDAQAIVNIFMFNGEPDHTISGVLSFKYKKKVGLEALRLHRELFWDCLSMDAKSAIYYCKSFQKPGLVLKCITTGGATIGPDEDLKDLISDMKEGEDWDGDDTRIVFHDMDYIKWKIGLPDAKVPDTKTFLEEVKKLAIFKFRETMHDTHSVESECKEGNNATFGDYKEIVTRKRNVEEVKVKKMKSYLDMFIKAEKSMPDKGEDSEKFFERVDQLELNFGDTKIAVATDDMNLFKDIAGDVR